MSIERALVRLWLLAHIAALGPAAADTIRTSWLHEDLYPLHGPAYVERSIPGSPLFHVSNPGK